MATKNLLTAFLLATAVLTGCAVEQDDEDFGDEEIGDNEAEAMLAAPLSADVTTEVHFTNPDKKSLEKPGHDPEILEELIRLIKKTPKGESIRLAIHSIANNKVQAALQEASDKGVNVYVAHDGSNQKDDDEDSPETLAKKLGKDHRWCGNKKADVGGCISPAKSSIMHSKLALFSKTEDATGKPRTAVTWFGSANMTNKTGANTYNNTVTIYGDTPLYQQFKTKYFHLLWTQDHTHGTNFYDASAHRGYFGSGASGTTVFASPSRTDIIIGRLNQIVPGEGCEIRVAEAMIFDSRLNVLNKLFELKTKKCDVKIVGNRIQPGAKALLAKHPGIPVSQAETHDKLILVKAKFGCADKCANAPLRKLVFTGSHNLTSSANDLNDELFVKIENPAVYDRFVEHFQTEFTNGKKLQ